MQDNRVTVATVKPLMAWESNELADAGGKVIWWTRFDARYQIEVHAGDDENEHHGHLYIWDRRRSMLLVHQATVALSYGAKFGPDVADIVAWKRIAMAYADRQAILE